MFLIFSLTSNKSAGKIALTIRQTLNQKVYLKKKTYPSWKTYKWNRFPVDKFSQILSTFTNYMYRYYIKYCKHKNGIYKKLIHFSAV